VARPAAARPPAVPQELAWIRPPHQARTQRQLEALLDAAHDLLLERPFEAVSVAAVCERAGTSVAGFYRRFRDKEALLHALHERHAAEALATARAALDPARWEGAPVPDVVAAFVRLLVRTEYRRGGLRRAVAERSRTDAAFRERKRAVRACLFDGLRELLEARRDEIGHPDPETATRLLVRLVFGVLARRSDGDGLDEELAPLDDAQLEAELARAALAYLGVDVLASRPPPTPGRRPTPTPAPTPTRTRRRPR